MDSSIKKIVAPQKQTNGKTYWNTIGIMGVKNGKVWLKLNMIPTGWDGYAMGVDKEDNAAGKTGQGPDTEGKGGETPYEGETF